MFHDLSRIIDHQHYLATQRCLDEILGGGGRGGYGGGDGCGGSTSGGSTCSTPSTSSPRPGRSPAPAPPLGRTGGGWRENPTPEPPPRESSSSTLEEALARLGFRDPEEFYRLGGERRRAPGGGDGVGDALLRSLVEDGGDASGPPRWSDPGPLVEASPWGNGNGNGKGDGLRTFAVVEDDDIYGATPLSSPRGLWANGDGASAPPPVEEDDIYGATPLCSPRHSQGDRNAASSPAPAPAPTNPLVKINGIYGVAHSRSPSPSHQPRVPQDPYPTVASPLKPESTPKGDPPPPILSNTSIHPSHYVSHRLSPPAQDPNVPTTSTPTDALSSITSLTLIAEDVPELAAFYVAVFDNVTLLPPQLPAKEKGEGKEEEEEEEEGDEEEPEEMTLALNGGALLARLLSSRAARRRRALGPEVHVGRRRDAGRRAMLGARVRDVEAVHARLARLEGPGGGRLVNELTAPATSTVGGAGGGTTRRSVMFWDPAGHCWEVWEEREAV